MGLFSKKDVVKFKNIDIIEEIGDSNKYSFVGVIKWLRDIDFSLAKEMWKVLNGKYITNPGLKEMDLVGNLGDFDKIVGNSVCLKFKYKNNEHMEILISHGNPFNECSVYTVSDDIIEENSEKSLRQEVMYIV